MPRHTLGEFEKLVLLAILRLGPDAYGATVLREIEERTGRTVTAGAAYVALRRLEKKLAVRSQLGQPTPERGGRPKRFFQVTPRGLRTLQAAAKEWEAMVAGLDGLLERDA